MKMSRPATIHGAAGDLPAGAMDPFGADFRSNRGVAITVAP